MPSASLRGEYIADCIIRAQENVRDWGTAIEALRNGGESDDPAVKRGIKLLKQEQEQAQRELQELSYTRYILAPAPKPPVAMPYLHLTEEAES
jgi:hypothetical protein